MIASDLLGLLGPDLSTAFAEKGYTTLTQVQQAVLDPALADRDLRISSQTGSGKTLAIGFSVRHAVTAGPKPKDGIARPTAVVVAPTRELAKQVEAELAWLYAPSKALVASVTGGTSVRDDYRMLARGPALLVGTPGRLLDHATRGAIDLSQTKTIVLDEADRMLDLGFREDLEAILALAPAGHRTHLVSATFPREVEALARRVQENPAFVQGTPLGTANQDIDHVVHLVKPDERVAALINLLLSCPGEQVLAFARTRADVSRVCEELDAAGFAVDSLSGEMEQDARHRALSAFKNGKLDVLVATDVAARGIDHQDIARVVQLEPPTDADTYTHRSGRTGRAGRKGKSSIMVQPAGVSRLVALLKRAGVRHRFEPIPSSEQIALAQDERIVNELSAELAGEGSDPNAKAPLDPRTREIAARLVAAGHAERALAHLLAKTRRDGTCAPREITRLDPNSPQRNGGKSGAARGPRPFDTARGPRPFDTARGSRPGDTAHGPRPFDTGRALRPGDTARGPRSFDAARPSRPQVAPRFPREGGEDREGGEGWVRFRISWGAEEGADARRLLPMLCRRGKIRGSDIGSIKLAPSFSLVDVATRVATEFERATQRPDPRDPAISVRREGADFQRETRPRYEGRPPFGRPRPN